MLTLRNTIDISYSQSNTRDADDEIYQNIEDFIILCSQFCVFYADHSETDYWSPKNNNKSH